MADDQTLPTITLTPQHTAIAPERGEMDSGSCKSFIALVDSSGSISVENSVKQLTALAEGFRSQRVQDAIFANDGSVAIFAGEFNDTMTPVKGWTSIDTPAELNAYADELEQKAMSSRVLSTYGYSNITGALGLALEEFKSSPCQSDSRIVDLSSDGIQTPTEFPLADVPGGPREQATEEGVTVNVIAVNGAVATMQQAYEQLRDHVRTPTGRAYYADWENYDQILEQKMHMEFVDAAPEEKPVSPDITPEVRKAEIDFGRSSL